MEKFGWADRVINEILRGVKEERNIVRTEKRRMGDYWGHLAAF